MCACAHEERRMGQLDFAILAYPQRSTDTISTQATAARELPASQSISHTSILMQIDRFIHRPQVSAAASFEGVLQFGLREASTLASLAHHAAAPRRSSWSIKAVRSPTTAASAAGACAVASGGGPGLSCGCGVPFEASAVGQSGRLEMGHTRSFILLRSRGTETSIINVTTMSE